jgi:hypothetical protein
VCDLLLVAGDGGHSAFLCEDIEGDGEGVLHLFEEVGVVAEAVAGEKGADLRGGGRTWSSSAT